ncbi:MAG: hypothetical protein HS050_02115 [Thaumarchaeota archaeon]|nr:hypothetical protein [Nitrososphaerota archaeon]
MTRPISRKLSYNSFILCPDGHKNVRGLEECATCNLPLINFKKELSLLIDNLNSVKVKNLHKVINFGIGDFGSQTLLSFKNSIHPERLNHLLVDFIDSEKNSSDSTESTSNDSNYYLIDEDYDSNINTWSEFENTFSEFDKFEDKIRRVGINNNIDEQTAIITGSIGETLVSGLTLPLIKKIKHINPKSSRIVLASLPSNNDTDQVQFNAYCGISRLVKNQKTSGDMLIVLQGNALNKMIGIDRSGKKLGYEILVPRILSLLTSNGHAINNLGKMAKSLKVLAFSPVYVYGRSYEIYDNLKNILDDAAFFPLSPFQYESIILSIVVIRVPESVLNIVSAKRLENDYNAWNRKRFPSLKESLIQIVPVKENSDRLDVLLLLGGAKLENIVETVKPGYDRFKEYIRELDLWNEFQISEDDLKKLENTITTYDRNLNKLLKSN